MVPHKAQRQLAQVRNLVTRGFSFLPTPDSAGFFLLTPLFPQIRHTPGIIRRLRVSPDSIN